MVLNRVLCASAILAGLLLGPLPQAAVAAPDQAVVLERLRKNFILPRYETLAHETNRMALDVNAFCRAPNAAGFQQVTGDFQKAADAWAAIEVIRFGPVGDDLNYDRMQHYPERKNAVTRGLAGLLESSDPEVLKPDVFKEQSVALQGFSALERLFYDTDALKKLTVRDEPALRRCAVASTITTAMARRSETIRASWVALDPDADATREMLARSVTDLITLYRLMIDTKVGSVMASGPTDVKPMAGEMWRAGRVNRILAINAESAADMVAALLGEPTEDTRSALATAESARDIAKSMPGPLAILAADPKRRSRVVLLRSALHSAQEMSEAILPGALGITVGFNSLDGD